MNKNLKIGIIGLGLIGGSIFKALCALKCDVYATSKSNLTLKKAKQYTKKVSDSLDSLVNCDVIFVCTPMNKTLEILDKLEEIIPKEMIVVDTCSLKKFVTEKKYSYKLVPSHPMAGTEHSGFDSSFEALFQGAKWVITPIKNTKKKDINKVKDIIEVLGAKPILTTAEEHDEAVALISHMPMLIAQSLFKNVIDNKLALKLASSGFRDMTRLALSNVEMATDMINLNAQNVQNSLLKLYSSVGELLNNDYLREIKRIKTKREHIYKNGINIY